MNTLVLDDFIGQMCEIMNINHYPQVTYDCPLIKREYQTTFAHAGLEDLPDGSFTAPNRISLFTKDLSLDRYKLTIIHELTHYKQHLESKLIGQYIMFNDGAENGVVLYCQVWMDKPRLFLLPNISFVVALPWEIEAKEAEVKYGEMLKLDSEEISKTKLSLDICKQNFVEEYSIRDFPIGVRGTIIDHFSKVGFDLKEAI